MKKREVEKAERDLVLTIERGGSWFTAKLIELMLKADTVNFEKLKSVYPEIATVVWRFKNEKGYYERLMKRYGNK